MDAYREFVENLAKEEDPRIFLNSGPAHAQIVLSQIFLNAKKDIRIFAECLCNEVAKSEEYIDALCRFVEKNGNVKILLNGINEENKNPELFKRLAKCASENNSVSVRSTEIKPRLTSESDSTGSEVHFTLGDDKSYRIETDIEAREATCSFNDTKISAKFSAFFDAQFEVATKVPLYTLI